MQIAFDFALFLMEPEIFRNLVQFICSHIAESDSRLEHIYQTVPYYSCQRE